MGPPPYRLVDNRSVHPFIHGEYQRSVIAHSTLSLLHLHPPAAACDSIIEILYMEPLGGSQNPAPGTTVHTLQLSGLLTGGGGKILARCRMTFSRGEGVTLELGFVERNKKHASL